MMTVAFKQTKEHKDPEYFVNPKKFVLWLFIIASVMLFAAFTSAYIVRRWEGNWVIFDLPPLFKVNTVVMLVSSFFMQWAYFSAKKDSLIQTKLALIATLILGLCFAAGQWEAYHQLIDNKVFLTGNPAESFIYVIPFIHLLHIAVGICFVLAVTVKTFQYKVHKKNLLTINLCTTYWHFLGALWIYLYFFFLLNR